MLTLSLWIMPMKNIGRNFKALWKSAMTPSAPNETPYQFVVIAIGHAMVGAAMSWGGFMVAALYWFVKERRDLKRGGAWLDGLVDTAFVALGLAYSGPIWWPMVVMFSAVFGAVLLINVSEDSK